MASTKTIDVELGNVKSFFTDVQEVSFDSSAAKSAINQLQSRHVDPGAILTTATTGEWLIEANALEQLSCCHFSLFLFVSSLQFTSFPNKSKTGVTNLLQIIFLLFTNNNKQQTTTTTTASKSLKKCCAIDSCCPDVRQVLKLEIFRDFFQFMGIYFASIRFPKEFKVFFGNLAQTLNLQFVSSLFRFVLCLLCWVRERAFHSVPMKKYTHSLRFVTP